LPGCLRDFVNHLLWVIEKKDRVENTKAQLKWVEVRLLLWKPLLFWSDRDVHLLSLLKMHASNNRCQRHQQAHL